jgi:hypothetical protein
MKEDCLEIGTVQAFMDGELAHEESARVSGHIAVCDACSVMLSVAEDESAIVFPALEREFNSLVPTQRLWNKINDSIAVEQKNKPFWHRAWAVVSGGLLTPSMAAAASLIIVVGVVSLALINRGLTVNTSPVAKVPTISSSPSVVSNQQPTTALPSAVQPETSGSATIAEQADYRPAVRRDYVAQPRVPVERGTSSGYMPGEESYVRTIASLSRSVADQKNDTIKGSERISFERDLAVVDDAITKMRSEVKRNPKNESAKQVLYSSYQNKIDLLNSVAQKEELVASLK